jgi:WD40-like Beta Propeller Repeat
VTRWREPAPGEQEAEQRSWAVVRAAYDERVRAPRSRDWRPLVALAAGVAILAAAFSPPGLAVWGSLRDAVQKEDHLVALPANGRVLVEADDGVWVVSRDGSKRFLSGYADASWSPHGLYVAAARANQLVAMEPDGDVHWQLARRGRVSSPRWSHDGYRIAYFAGSALRVVNGDGTGDRLLTRNVRLATPAWVPRSHALAYVDRRGTIVVVDVDRAGRPLRIKREADGPLRQLSWTPGRRLVAVGPNGLATFTRQGVGLRAFTLAAGVVTAAATSPDGRQLAFTTTSKGRSTVNVAATATGSALRVFTGNGRIDGVTWSPDGRWLLVDWPSADQWLFIRLPAKKLVAVSNISATYGHGAALGTWCCP